MAKILSFSREDRMYGIIADFLQHERRFSGCRTVVNKVYFNLLKGWRIDVAGLIEKKNNYIIAVEAKKDISPESILQAISQGEMYQKTCNEVYIALPSDEIDNFKKENKTEWENIVDLCRVKGIGIIRVGTQWQDCRILNEAMRIPRYDNLYREIVNQLNFETLESFQGFEEHDFDYFIGIADEKAAVLKKKIQLLIEKIRHSMLSKPRDFPAIDPRKLVAELPLKGFRRDFCWFFVAEVGREKVAYVPHFTFHVDQEGVSCMLSLQTIRTTDKFVEKLRNQRDDFLDALKRLRDVSEEYKLKIWEQVPKKGRRSQMPWRSTYSFNVGYIDEDVVELILSKLASIRYPVVRVLCPPVKRDDSRLYTNEIAEKCTDWIKELQEIYKFLS